MRGPSQWRGRLARGALVLVLAAASRAHAADSFVNFESGHTRPLALSPDESLLFALNTPDNRLSVFAIDALGLELAAEIPVGLEPVAVATRVNASTGRTEAWVVNHLSDSVSVVEIDPLDVALSRVTRTLLVADEPRDVVFGGSVEPKAFVTTARRGQNLPAGLTPRFTEEGVARALVWVFDAEAPGGGIGGAPTTVLELFGDTPRALAVSPDGSTVYAAIFQSGNATTLVRHSLVTANGGMPPLPPDSPYFGDESALDNTLIVKHDPTTGEWNDELGRDWAPQLKLGLPDFDVFAIDADADPPVLASGVDRFSGVGTTLFNMAVRPGTGSVFVSNTEARNEVRFAPIQAGGVRGHVTETRITVIAGMAVAPVHLNPHIDYDVATGPPAEVAESLALINDMVFATDGATLWAAALGSDQVAAFDAAALEAGSVVRDLVDVGRGPSGVALDESRDRLYVLNRLDETISIVTDASDPGLREATVTVALGYDPTPAVVREGRRFLYDARETSGHGDAPCASCHTFGDVDHLSWDLGDPYGPILPNPNPFRFEAAFDGQTPQPFHPVKGPKTTQSLRGLANAGPMHWRGDRSAGFVLGGDPLDEDGAFKQFNPTFVDLMGRSAPLAASDMQAFTDFVMTLRYPPNPVRALDGALNTDEAAGFDFFTNHFDPGLEGACVSCHVLPLGTAGLSTMFDGIKVAHLRNVYQKIGMFGEDLNGSPPDPSHKGDQVRGFGLFNAGATAGVVDFIEASTDAPTAEDVGAFLLAFDTGLHPAVGQQLTLRASPSAQQLSRIDLLRARDAAGDCDLAVAAIVASEPRTGAIVANGGVWLDDSTAPLFDGTAFGASANASGGEQTYTCHPPGTGVRALDRDGDGVMNGDERDEGTNPGDASSVPFNCIGGAVEQIAGAKFKVTKNDEPAGDERFSLKGQWLATGAPPIAPPTDGVNIVIRDGGGRIVLHRRMIGAAWTSNGAVTKWTYRSASPAGGGITKASIGRSADGTVKVNVKGKDSDFRLDRDDLTAEIVLGGDAAAAAGRCATRTFGAGGTRACVLTSKTLKCG